MNQGVRPQPEVTVLMLFADYYNGPFREDLVLVLAASPPAHEHDAGEITIQPKSISLANPVIGRWEPGRRLLFASGLFLTVLADQVCYSHFSAHYARFRELTQCPKWRGDCPGACHYHIHPGAVFRAIGAKAGRLGEIGRLPLELLPDDVLSTMQKEVTDFVGQYLPGVNPIDYWGRCMQEIPFEFKAFYLTSRSPAV